MFERQNSEVSSTKVIDGHIRQTLRHLESTCSYCHAYICAFTSNYLGRGNPVRQRTASSGVDQRTRYSELLHSLAVSTVATMLVGPPRRGTIHVVYAVLRLSETFNNFEMHTFGCKCRYVFLCNYRYYFVSVSFKHF